MYAAPLAEDWQLGEFPGAPFSAGVVASAGAQVRTAAGWHIAPQVTETLTVDSPGGPVLMLPTMHLLEVTAVRDVTGDEPRVLTGWRFSRNGVLRGSFPCGPSAVEVDVVHGFDECPRDLLPLIASLASGRDRSLASVSRGPFSESYRDVTLSDDPALAPYVIPPRP